MLTQQEIKGINKRVDIGLLLTFLGAPIKNLTDLHRKGTDYRINAWYRGGDNPNGIGITYYFGEEKWRVTDFTSKEFGNLDLIDFMTKVLNIPFRQAIEHLTFASGKKNGFETRSIQSQNIYQPPKLYDPIPIDPSVMNIFEHGLHSYWQNRGFTKETAELFKLGFCSAHYGNLKHRLTIPIFDEKNRLVAVQGRTMDEDTEPKYTYANGPQGESAKLVLYNYLGAKVHSMARGWVGVVESANSVWRANQYGYHNFLATLSTSVTDRQLNLLAALGKNVVIFFDYDSAHTMAGQIAAMKLANRLYERRIPTWICNIGFVSDPEKLSSQQFQMTLKNAFQFKGGQ